MDIKLRFLLEVKEQIKRINSCKSTEQQLKEVKILAKLVTPDRAADENEKIATILLKIYFKEKVKHPAKSTIQRQVFADVTLPSITILFILAASIKPQIKSW